MPQPATAPQYLILRSEIDVEAAKSIFGTRRLCITAQQAMNGSRNDLDGADVLIWGLDTAQSIGWDRALALELAPDCKRVRLFDMSLPSANMYTPTEAAKHNTTYEALSAWADTCGIVKEIPKPPPQELEPVNAAPPDRSESVSIPAPQEVHDSDGAAPDMPDTLPIEAYQDEFSGPTDDEHAYVPPRPYVSYAEAVGGSEWPHNPTNFWRETKPPEMRSEWMPDALADYFGHEAETWGADPGIFWGYGTGICAGSLSDAVKVRVKPDDPNWLQSARLWLCIAGDSGDNKTPVLSVVLRPLIKLEQVLMERAKSAIEQFNDDQEAYEQQRKRYITAKVDGKTTDRPAAPERPCRNRLIVRNSTLQGLRTVLQDQGDRGILECHDELISVFTGANQFKAKGGDDLQERLKLWDGGYHSFDLNNQLIGIPNWSTSIIGGTQPNKLRTIVGRMGLADDGNMQRFNVYLTRHAALDLERPAHEGHVLFTDIVERLYEMQHQGYVNFSPEAHQIRRDFFIWAHNQRQQPWMNGALKSHLAKYNNFFARFCMTYHGIQCAANHSAYIEPVIPAKIARQVSALLKDCLFRHAECFYNDVLEDSSEVIIDVRRLAEKLLAKNPSTIDLTWITQGWTRWRTFKPWQKKSILTMLAESGWIRPKDPRGYVDGMSYHATVNPRLQDIFAEYVGPIQTRLEEMEDRRQEKMRD